MYGSERDRRWAAVYAHRARLLRIARARVENAHDAEDCVQEAMLRCIEFADLDEARLGQFLTSVTVRLCADVHRRRMRGDRLSRKLEAYDSVEPGPEDAVCDRAESAWLSRHLDQLSPRQREIVEARAAGLSCTAVAERVALTATAVESAMARVRRSLRVALESTLGVAPFRRFGYWRGARRTGAAALLLTAAVAVSIGFAPGEVEHHATPRHVALPPVAPGVTGGSAGQAPGRGPAVPTAGGAGLGAGSRAAGTVPPGSKSVHSFARARVLDLPDTGLHRKEGPKYTLSERVAQCVYEGVAVGEEVQCRYPKGDPRNEPEEAGTPPLPHA